MYLKNEKIILNHQLYNNQRLSIYRVKNPLILSPQRSFPNDNHQHIGSQTVKSTETVFSLDFLHRQVGIGYKQSTRRSMPLTISEKAT